MSYLNDAPQKEGNAKWWVGYAAAFAAAFTTTHIENSYGTQFFAMANLPPAVFKGFIEGTFVGFFVWLTPSHLVQSVTDAILFIKSAFRQWRDAISNSNQEKPNDINLPKN